MFYLLTYHIMLDTKKMTEELKEHGYSWAEIKEIIQSLFDAEKDEDYTEADIYGPLFAGYPYPYAL